MPAPKKPKEEVFHLPRPLKHNIKPHYPLSRKLEIIRSRLHARGYSEAKHPDAPREKSRGYFAPGHQWSQSSRGRINLDSPFRSSFTAQEIEMMWLCLCEVMSFVGGNKSLLSRLIGLQNNVITGWITRGRVSPWGAWLIDQSAEIPLSKEQVRPDINRAGWEAFAKQVPRLYHERARKLNQSTFRVAVPRKHKVPK